MITLEMFRIALESIRAHKMRSFLNLLGIIIAVTTIIAVISVVSGLNEYAANIINQLGPNTFIITKFGIITSREEFLQAMKRKDITLEDVDAVRRLVPKAVRVCPRVFSQQAVYAEGSRLADTFFVGTGPEMPWMVGMELDDGRYFTDVEDRAARPVAVVGWDVKDQLFPNVDPIGRLIKVSGKPFRIVGLLIRQGKIFGQSQDQVVLVPFSSYEKAMGKSRSIDIFVEAPDSNSIPSVMEGVRTVMRSRRGTSYRDPDPFDIIDAEALQSFWRQITFFGFALVIWIASISLLVGGVAIANTMFASIMERTQEIGIRKAIGARRRDIRRQFLFEAMTLSTFGGIVGIGFGWIASKLVEAYTPFPARVSLFLMTIGLVVSVLSGLLAGWVPALRASRLDPVEAIRSE
ncbi:MAG: ABC transporter permease [Acidobacteriota bacterium]